MKILSVLLALALATSLAAADRPNIVFASADDWGWPHASIYGNDDVCQTPTFDRVARNGVLFHHAYVSSPSCTPSRNAILTGQETNVTLEPGDIVWVPKKPMRLATSTLDLIFRTAVITIAANEGATITSGESGALDIPLSSPSP